MDEDTLQSKFDAFGSVFKELLGRFLEANLNYGADFYRIFHDALYSLKTYIEDPKEKEITWEDPYCELQYPAKVTEEPSGKSDNTALSFWWAEITDKDLEDREKILRRLVEGIYNTKCFIIFSDLTRCVATVKRGEEYTLLLPPEQKRRIERLPREKRESALSRLSAGYTFDSKGSHQVTITDTDTGRERKCKLSVILQFLPLVIDQDENTAYFPVVTGLKYTGYPPTKWSREAREAFWEQLLQTLKDNTPQEQPWLEGMKPQEWGTLLSGPIVKPAITAPDLIRVSTTLEEQKFGLLPLSGQLDLLETLENDQVKREARELKLSFSGIAPSQAQSQAIFAIQTYLHRTDYQGNAPTRDPSRPRIRFRTITEYLNVYGLQKHPTSRGKLEYSPKEREQALRALEDLTKPFIMVIDGRYWSPEGQELTDRIERIAPLITITRGYKALTYYERKRLDHQKPTKKTDQKLRFIEIEVDPIFVKLIDKRFLLKPENHYTRIRQLAPGASQYIHRLVDYLVDQAEKQRQKALAQNGNPWNGVIGLKPKTWAHRLKMYSIIKKRDWQRIRRELNNCYQTAKELGYLLDYKTVQGKLGEKDVLTLNPEMFPKVKEYIAQHKQKRAVKDQK